MRGVYTFILFCRNPRKDRFDEPASCFRLDEKADLPVDHQFPKLALGRLFVGSTPSTWANCHNDSKRFNNSIDAGDDFVIVVGLGLGVGTSVNTIDGGSI